MNLENYTKEVREDGTIVFTPIIQDPYKELKKAYAAGEQIECLYDNTWEILSSPYWAFAPENYRVYDAYRPFKEAVARGEIIWFKALDGRWID